jgi:hypothetical protein
VENCKEGKVVANLAFEVSGIRNCTSYALRARNYSLIAEVI